MRQKGFAPIIILVLVVLAVVGYFGYKNFWPKLQTLVTPTPIADQTPSSDLANWKTYTNTKYGFSVKYPSKYEVVLNGDSAINFDDNKFDQNLTRQDVFGVYINLIYKDFDKIYSSLNNSVISSESHAEGHTYTKIHNLMIDGYKAVYSVSQGGPTSEQYRPEYVINRNGDIFAIWTAWRNKESFRGFEKTFDQILSTFKFTK